MEEVAKTPKELAIELLAEDLKQRTEACGREVSEVLSRHGFSLTTLPAQILLAPINGR